MITFRQIPTQDKNIQLIQDNVQAAFGSVSSSPFIGGNLITVTLSSSGANDVAHGLNRVPSVWVICGQNANSVIWSSGATDRFLTLYCTASVSIKVWVN